MNVHSLSNPLTKPLKHRDFFLTPGIGRNSSGDFQTRKRPPAKGLSFKPRAALASLRGIRGFVHLGRYRRRHPLRLLDKLQDRQDCAEAHERVNRRFHDAPALFL
jgi:hypothetical protein